MAGALAAAKLHIPVAHVESGLRSFDRRMPEEINRVLTDHVSEMLFAPTEGAVVDLKNEGIEGDKVRLVGDVMYDAALYYSNRADKLGRQPADYGLRKDGYVLATVHRAENTDQDARLRSIIDGLGLLPRDVPVNVPLHPRTRAALARIGFELDSIANLRFTEPLNYLDMVNMERHAALRPKLLAPLNRIWTRIGRFLHHIANFVILTLLFYLVITPTGLALRLLGKDPLRLRFEPGVRSYWIERRPPGPAPETIKHQF